MRSAGAPPADAASTLAHGTIAVWLAGEAQLDDPRVAAACESLLSEEERERADRMRVASARRQQVLARAMQRTVLAGYLAGSSPHALHFERSAGRPSLAGPCANAGMDFNIAHTAGLVVMAVTRGARVGVDVERIDRRVPLPVARRHFSAAEADALQALPAGAREERFLRLWTLKEACLKAIGTGIAGGLGSLSFEFDVSGACRLEPSTDVRAAHWRFRQFAVGDSFLLAVAIRLGAVEPVVEWHEFHAGARQGAPLPVRALP